MFTTQLCLEVFSSLTTFYLQTNPNNVHITLISAFNLRNAPLRRWKHQNHIANQVNMLGFLKNKTFIIDLNKNVMWCSSGSVVLHNHLKVPIFNIGTPLSFWKRPAQPSNELTCWFTTKPRCSPLLLTLLVKPVRKLKRTSAPKTQQLEWNRKHDAIIKR